MRVATVSPARSRASGAVCCILAASSYAAIRESSRVSPSLTAAWLRLSCSSTASPSRWLSAVMKPAEAGGNKSGIGRGAPASRIVPWCDCGRNPDVKFPLAL